MPATQEHTDDGPSRSPASGQGARDGIDARGRERRPALRSDWREDDWSRWTRRPDLTDSVYQEAAEVTAELIGLAMLRRSARDDPYPSGDRFASEGSPADPDLLHPLAG
jgi:hypothetical protein